jgi:RNA polymerase sigma factor (sigma-70 family)
MQDGSFSDDRRIEEAVEALAPQISAVMARYQIPTVERHDLLQEAILAVLERPLQIDSIDNLQAWLLTVIRNRCSIYQRRQTCWRRLVEPVDPSDLQELAAPIDPPHEYRLACRDLRTMWRELSDADKRLLWMCYKLDLGRKEIAAELRCHPANIVKLLRRVLTRMRAAAKFRTVYR